MDAFLISFAIFINYEKSIPMVDEASSLRQQILPYPYNS